MPLRLDYTNMLAPAVAGGVPEAEWRRAGELFATACATVARQRSEGVLGFLDLPADAALRAQSDRFAEGRRGFYHDVVILGIGGSALGPIALRTALRPPYWNLLDDRARGGAPRLHVLDNVDPRTIAGLLSMLDLARALFIVTSKSGGTAETMAQYLIVRDRLHATPGIDPARHLVFVTDPRQGALRPIADRDGIPALDIPPNVGGRFSVLSPVGLLPAAIIGIDTAGLLTGANAMVQRCATTDDLARNPAGAYAMLQWLADTRAGGGIHVMMPYADALRDFASWFVQLWAESLGKERPDGTHVGPTPIAALGATDQHSQVQLFMEGPIDKTVTFLAVASAETDLGIPPGHPDVPELSYLGGRTLGELLDVERRATAGALARRGRPNMTLMLDRVDPTSVGELIMLLELATVYAGALYGVNPLDQPGVELGKRFTYAMLGRPGFDGARREWDALPRPDPRHTI
jgi:glucose-6-phosphate isomerase